MRTLKFYLLEAECKIEMIREEYGIVIAMFFFVILCQLICGLFTLIH